MKGFEMIRIALVLVSAFLIGFVTPACSSGNGTGDTGNPTGTGTGTGTGTSQTGTPGSTVVFPVPGAGSGQVKIYVPSSYSSSTAAPVIFLFNEQIFDWQTIADTNGILLIDLDEYNDSSAIMAKLNAAATHIEQNYTVDTHRYYWAGWSAGGNIVIIIGAQNQDFIAATMVFPGTGGSSAQSAMQSRSGHKIRLYYACGTADSNYPWADVQNEANFWANYGYTTRFDKVEGADHSITESVYHKRADAWNWVKGFTNQN
jgi:dienelactone hydrolase